MQRKAPAAIARPSRARRSCLPPKNRQARQEEHRAQRHDERIGGVDEPAACRGVAPGIDHQRGDDRRSRTACGAAPPGTSRIRRAGRRHGRRRPPRTRRGRRRRRGCGGRARRTRRTRPTGPAGLVVAAAVCGVVIVRGGRGHGHGRSRMAAVGGVVGMAVKGPLQQEHQKEAGRAPRPSWCRCRRSSSRQACGSRWSRPTPSITPPVSDSSTCMRPVAERQERDRRTARERGGRDQEQAAARVATAVAAGGRRRPGRMHEASRSIRRKEPAMIPRRQRREGAAATYPAARSAAVCCAGRRLDRLRVGAGRLLHLLPDGWHPLGPCGVAGGDRPPVRSRARR